MTLNPVHPHETRRQNLINTLSELGLDALWITNLPNIRYLTGFTGSSAQVVLTPDSTLFCTDGRYSEQVENEVQGCRILIQKNQTWSSLMATEIEEQGWYTIGFECDHLTCGLLTKVQKACDSSPSKPDLTWKPQSGLVEQLRLCKDPTELTFLEDSARIIDQVYARIPSLLHEGMSEKELERKLINLLWDAGAAATSFDPIVLFGARTSLPHGTASTENRLAANDWILLDFGGMVEGYCSDFTRTFAFGNPDPRLVEMHQLVAQAYQTGLSAIRSGISCREVDAAARSVFDSAGVGPAFLHSLGHGLGLEIHENPRLSPTSEEILAENMVVTVEPGLYVEGLGGVRLENAVRVTRQGALSLTASPLDYHPIG
jgi:Xaa-Pro aminopeptidase